MRRVRRATRVLFLSLLAPLTSSLLAQGTPARALPAAPPSTADVAAAATPATVTILAIGTHNDTLALGSGFIVRESGVVLTNFHVLRGASSAVVVLPNKEIFTRVTVLDADSSIDLALLKIPTNGLPALATRTTTPRVGEKVIAIGSPLGLSQTVSEGIVSATRMVGGRELVQITAPISHGSSGGAVLDADGKVFAVSTSLVEEGQAINFAIPVRYALGLLSDNRQARQVAEVFGRSVNDGVVQSGAAAATDLAVTRATTPRASVSGIYRVVQKVRASADAPIGTQVGFLIAGTRVGLLALATVLGRDSLTPTHVYDVVRWATTDNGDVVLVAGGATWDGYQTSDAGFVGLGQTVSKKGMTIYSIRGIPASLPLSRNDGLFAVTSRSQYRTARGELTPNWFDWRGELVVAFAHDTIYTSMYLTNDRGGNVTFRAHGPLVNHQSFDITDERGSHLKGLVRNGILNASFEDVRADGAGFVGTVSAERR